MPSSPAENILPRARRIEPKFVERVWGRTDLSPLYPPQQNRIGEVWFSTPGSPLLVKFIFTSEDLSVQVHPEDEYAATHHGSAGKTEMWHILAAEPGARLAIGFHRSVEESELREALKDGSVEHLLKFVTVQPGETYFIPAGVVHAICRGITLCEIQQNSDITYRLYDYGRPRELHLDHGLKVAALGPFDARRSLPIVSEFFKTEALEIVKTEDYRPLPGEWLVILKGTIQSPDGPLEAGEVWEFPTGAIVPLTATTPASTLRVSPAASFRHLSDA